MIELSVDSDEGGTLRAPSPTIIKIIGCGGGGSSAVNRMIDAGVSDVDFIVLNTDLQALTVSKAQKKLAIGHQLTGGLGAGGNPSVGENAAKEDTEAITNLVRGADMVIITAGMGGGTGTGSAPIVAAIAREQGALTIAVVTTPFDFEGAVRRKYAHNGLKRLRENVDSLIVIPNQQIMKVVDKKLNYRQAFRLADDVLCQGVQGISEIITKPGEVNIDFADVKTVMKDKGDAILGVGIAGGENRAVDAAQAAIGNPMLDDRHIDGARNILINITSAEDLAMAEVEEIVRQITAAAHPETNVFWGQVLDTSMGDKISVTVIATGFEATEEEEELAASAEKERLANSNVMSYSDFDRLINGRASISKAEEEEEEPVSEKVSTVPVNTATAFEEDDEKTPSDLFVDSSAKKAQDGLSLSDSLKQAMRQNRGKAASSVDRNSMEYLKQPACLRGINGLGRSISLTDD